MYLQLHVISFWLILKHFIIIKLNSLDYLVNQTFHKLIIQMDHLNSIKLIH